MRLSLCGALFDSARVYFSTGICELDDKCPNTHILTREFVTEEISATFDKLIKINPGGAHTPVSPVKKVNSVPAAASVRGRGGPRDRGNPNRSGGSGQLIVRNDDQAVAVVDGKADRQVQKMQKEIGKMKEKALEERFKKLELDQAQREREDRIRAEADEKVNKLRDDMLKEQRMRELELKREQDLRDQRMREELMKRDNDAAMTAMRNQMALDEQRRVAQAAKDAADQAAVDAKIAAAKPVIYGWGAGPWTHCRHGYGVGQYCSAHGCTIGWGTW